ncbi:MAG: xylulokinase [Chloroflexota bacterium]|nr:xylulokinase [Chloroflexota bacterium]
MARTVVLGVDSGTQSTKVVALDVESGEVVGQGRAPHSGVSGAEPPLSVQHPSEWWRALRTAVAGAVPDGSDLRVAGLSVGGQQHGFVTLDAAGEIVRPAPLWNNVAAAPDAERLNALADFAGVVGTRLVASVTISKLAHLARTSPDDLTRTAAICLPHDWLNLQLTGEMATDRGDASGSGWWSPREGRDRRDLLALAAGEEAAERLRLPAVRGPEEPAGSLSSAAAAELGLPAGIPVGPGTGDNMAAALGVGAGPDEVVISLGTSGTAFVVSDRPTADETGEVCGFADATGRFMPLACMINCTRVVDAIAGLLGIDRATALDRTGTVPPGAGGLLLMPYLAGERTPNLPRATGSITGLTDGTATPDMLLRAALDGVAAGLAYCVEALARLGISAPVATMVGGGSAHPAWQQAVADATGLPVTVRTGGEHAARGAAMQAAAIVRGERVADVVAAWRPAVIAEVEPRPWAREAFALDERRRLISAQAAVVGRDGEAKVPVDIGG